ncbi:hypothetical protein JZ785_06420 [Alicyclobacillus curvatus]|jgi:uncharacterized protein YpmB|nr:hypothetical protein JZ785_06420 [Alicyclobacillus curvatus]
MKAWTIWLSTLLFLLIIAAIFVGTSLWNNLASEWKVEQTAAQYALNHSPLKSIAEHDVFTGNGVEEVFQGKDAFGRGWFVVVYGKPYSIRSIQTSAVKNSKLIKADAENSGLQVIATHFGYLDQTGRSQVGTNTDFVWEVYGKSKKGNYQYVYFDAKTGRLLKSY